MNNENNILCPNCGNKIEKNNTFCSNCGSRIELGTTKEEPKNNNFCSNCGQELAPNVTFCSNCGEKVVKNSEQNTNHNINISHEPQNNIEQNNNEIPSQNISNSKFSTENILNNVKDYSNKLPKKTKTIILAVIVIIALVLIFKAFGGFGGRKNTTGITRYSGSDVDYNCSYEVTEGDTITTYYIDLDFNSKQGSTTYQLMMYTKAIIKYKTTLTDDKYKEAMKKLSAVYCGNHDCTANHLEIGITSLGWDTTVNRQGDKIEVTYYNPVGMSRTVSNSEIKDMVNDLNKHGYHCK